MLPSTGIMTLTNIQTIIGGEAPIKMSEYYNVTGGLAQGISGIPGSGVLNFSTFRNKSKNLNHGTAVRETPQQTYNTSGSFTYTITISGYYIIECIGGGGGGGNQYNGWVAGGGGGGGAFASGIRWFNSGDTLNITVGAGGAGGPGITPNVHANGSPGTATTISISGIELLRANGGGAGLGSTGITGGVGGTASAHSSMGALRLFNGGNGGTAHLIVNAFHNGGGGGSSGNTFGTGFSGAGGGTVAGGAPQIGFMNTGRGGNGYFFNISTIISNDAGQGPGAGGGGGHDLPGGLAGAAGIARITRVIYYGNDSLKTFTQPKIWLRARDLTSVITHLGTVTSWPSSAGTSVATGLRTGSASFPILHLTTETHPFIRLQTDTGTSSTTGGGYFTLGSQTLNMATGGGFTLVAVFRFYASGTWARIIDFGDGSGDDNLIVHRFNANNNLGITYANGATFSDNSGWSGATISGGWQIAAFRYTGTSASYFTTSNTSGTPYTLLNKVETIPVQNKTISTCYIGRSHWSGDSYANLDIRELIIYDLALSDATLLEILATMNAQYS
jgi:hypothetical protein